MILLFPISFVIYGLEEKINVGKADFYQGFFCPLLEVVSAALEEEGFQRNAFFTAFGLLQEHFLKTREIS